MSNPDEKKHFKPLDRLARECLLKIRFIRVRHPFVFYSLSFALVFVGWLLSNAAWQYCQRKVGCDCRVNSVCRHYHIGCLRATMQTQSIRFQYFGKPYNPSMELLELSFEAEKTYGDPNRFRLVFWPIVAADKLMTNHLRESDENLKIFSDSLIQNLDESGNYKSVLHSEREQLYYIIPFLPEKAEHLLEV